MYAPVLVSPPDEAIVSTEDAKLHLHVDGTIEDGLVESLVAAATSHLDGYTGILGRALVSQVWRQDFDSFGRRLRLPLLAASIVSVTWRAGDGSISTIEDDSYTLQHDALGSTVRFSDSFSFSSDLYETAAIAVTFVAGYGEAEDVPQALRQAILLLVGHWYANREAVNVGNITTALPMSVEALVAPYRRVGI
jgi:uncharacterized phiE125 gp8 family phage protein